MSDPARGILIVEARFYEDIAEALAQAAIAEIERRGARYERVAVPGAFEIPAAIAMAAKAKPRFEGYVALGCVIRGETSHYDYVCGESARGLMDLSIKRRLAIGYGILTVDSREQAEARAGGAKGNKGTDAAAACFDMIDLKRRFGKDR
ncbi:MAG: 6,7-dimethyl-8-ribityllumazine synthase [Alphaproteobacteria bacterium]